MVWSEERWKQIESETRQSALLAANEGLAWESITRRARMVLRAYSTSFFIVTRFLPPKKRAKVEAIYAAVRYPDEIVDTFSIDRQEKLKRIDEWASHYEVALEIDSVKDALGRGVPSFAAGFSKIVR